LQDDSLVRTFNVIVRWREATSVCKMNYLLAGSLVQMITLARATYWLCVQQLKLFTYILEAVFGKSITELEYHVITGIPCSTRDRNPLDADAH